MSAVERLCILQTAKGRSLADAARTYAEAWHYGKLRRDGSLVVEHLQRTVRTLIEHGLVTDPLIAATWLHDLVEDCSVDGRHAAVHFNTIDALFGREVFLLVEQLTVLPGKDGEPERYRLIVASARRMSPAATVIKLADRLDNLRGLQEIGVDYARVYLDHTRDLLAAFPSIPEVARPLVAEMQEIVHETDERLRSAHRRNKSR